LDYLCDTCDTLGPGVGKQLHDGWVHSYFARRGSHCAGTRPIEKGMTAANDLQILISVVLFINAAIE